MPRRTKTATNSLKTPPGVGISKLLGVSVRQWSKDKWQYEAELVGGSYDGFGFTMIRSKKPVIGTTTTSNGEKYKLVAAKNGVAIFKNAGCRYA